MRIVSLVPSLTHMVCEFGLREQLVGCTTFCIAPAGLARTVRLIGGTKDPDLAAIEALAPSHILVNEEENKPEHIRACQALAATLVCFPKTPSAVPALLRLAGDWLGVAAAGDRHARDAETALAALAAAVVTRRRAGHWPSRSYLYYIWRDPYMVAGPDSYIAAMLAAAGLANAVPAGERYPVVPVATAAALAPALLLLSSEPYPFRSRDATRIQSEWPAAPPMLWIDGQLLSWYGTMTKAALTALRAWVDGEPTSLVRPLPGLAAGPN